MYKPAAVVKGPRKCSKEAQVLKRCQGIRHVSVIKTFNGNDQYEHVEFFATDSEFAVPDNVYIKIDATACKGTIGKLVDIEFVTWEAGERIRDWGMTYIIQIEGRKGTNRIVQWHSTILENHDGTTKYVRNVKKHVQEEIPVHVNKYKQPILEGDWIVGIGRGKKLHFGQVVRWTKSSVMVNPTPTIPNSKSIAITLPDQSVKLPEGPDYEQMVTMMALRGWTGL